LEDFQGWAGWERATQRLGLGYSGSVSSPQMLPACEWHRAAIAMHVARCSAAPSGRDKHPASVLIRAAAHDIHVAPTGRALL
jgi:hypothetical protein